jgi:hypothetical protein
MEANKASASLIIKLPQIDFARYHILKWAWRVTKFPEGADGRIEKKDDQAIGIYVSSGGLFNQHAIAYRWETDTPPGAISNVIYAGGIAKIKWIALRNKNDDCSKGFLIEERNVAEDFKNWFGYVPEKVGISISCNSQYTKSDAAAELAWIALIENFPTNNLKR